MRATCPRCGRHALVARFVGVVQATQVKGVDGDGLILYGETTTSGGTMECVRCTVCGEAVLDEGGDPIRSLAELAGWLAARAVSGQH